jgi:BlaI family transcriptional regulator, penicillinase repressor
MEAIPTDRELEALKVLWRDGETTVRDICDRMNEGGGKLAYTTVLSLLQVMEQKGLVRHRQSGKAYLYAAEVRRESTFQQLAGGFLEKVFDGAVDEYLVHALQSRHSSEEELDRLEAMIAAARNRKKSGSPTASPTESKRNTRKGRQS